MLLKLYTALDQRQERCAPTRAEWSDVSGKAADLLVFLVLILVGVIRVFFPVSTAAIIREHKMHKMMVLLSK